jgi:hypothetical protein
MRLTAEEARKLSGKTLDEKVDGLLAAIAEAAKQHKRQLRTGWDYGADEELWIQHGYSKTEDWKTARKILVDLGYTVEFYYEESQFVDMYTLIKW